MIPRHTLILFCTGLAGAGIAGAAMPALLDFMMVAAILGVLTVAADAILSLRIPLPDFERRLAGSMSLMTWTTVTLTLQNERQRAGTKVQIFDHHPESFDCEALPFELVVPAGRFVDVEYRVRPTARGPQLFPGADLRIASPLGFWWRRRFVSHESAVRVYPNYSTIAKLLAYQVDNRLQASGVRLSRRRGEGIEFHQLRDYRDGDGLRSIDWKATARMRRLIAREYQDERDQQVVFLLDAGRGMLTKDADLSHFDHTLNAMLLLGFVALRQGDAVGIMTVGAERSWLPPKKGAMAINGLLNHVYGVEPKPVEVDYVAAATDLSVKQRRRSLVVVLTNVREEDSDELRIATDLLKRRHLVIVASLRERAIDQSLNHRINKLDDALLFAATNQYLDARRESHNLLRARGIFVEDCLADELPSAITNRYLAIKRAGTL